ncbi:unnamed protein product, partial [Symbiodinium microadriaticum]
MFRKDILDLTAIAFSSSCAGSISYSNLDYSWSFYGDNGVQLTGNEFASTSVNPRMFKLKPFSLIVNKFYYAKITVLHTVSKQASSATATVFVEQSDIIASISGGSERGIKLGESLTVDASASFDADTGSHEGLSFAWSCVQLQPSFGHNCPLVGDFAINSPTLVVTAFTEASNRTALVNVAVFDVYRRAETEISIQTIAPNSPTVVITSQVIKINPSAKLKLSGDVTVESDGIVMWTVSERSVELSESSLGPTSSSLVGISSSTTRTVNLVLAANSLSERSEFTFRLNCILSTGQSSSAALSIKTNGPPLGGRLIAIPTEGVMLDTEFQLLTSLWVDDDLPLSYEFGYFSTTDGSLMVLQSKSLKSFTVSTLPTGSEADNYVVQTVVQVLDSLSANST